MSALWFWLEPTPADTGPLTWFWATPSIASWGVWWDWQSEQERRVRRHRHTVQTGRQ